MTHVSGCGPSSRHHRYRLLSGLNKKTHCWLFLPRSAHNQDSVQRAGLLYYYYYFTKGKNILHHKLKVTFCHYLFSSILGFVFENY